MEMMMLISSTKRRRCAGHQADIAAGWLDLLLISGFGCRHFAYQPTMRIITGSAGGIPIAVPRTVIRPTADRVREAVFSILGSRVEGAAVLDLFAGSGSYGLECLSRGARRAVFVDSDRSSVAVISQNLAKARLAGGSVAGAPVELWLKRATESFDLIFADPPYAKARGDRDWNAVLLGSGLLPGLLAPGGLFILESFAKAGQVVPADAPWQAAHFPGRPLVPGVVLLQKLQAGCCEVDVALGALLELRQVRFILPVTAPARLHVAVRRHGEWLQCTVHAGSESDVGEGPVALRAQLRFGRRQLAAPE